MLWVPICGDSSSCDTEQLLPAMGAGIEVLPAPLRQVSVYTVPDKISQAGYALDAAVKLLDFYEDYFSIPYPLPKQGKCYLLTCCIGDRY